MRAQYIVKTPGNYFIVITRPDDAPTDALLIGYRNRVRIVHTHDRSVTQMLALGELDIIEAEVDGWPTLPILNIICEGEHAGN